MFLSRLLLLVLIAGACAAGCQKVDLRGDGYNDGTADWTGRMRTPTSKGQMSGLDGRAQEIERNLGVR
jgi:hypothetical protein